MDANTACDKLLTGGANAELLAWKLVDTMLTNVQATPSANVNVGTGGGTAGACGVDAESGDAICSVHGLRAVPLGRLAVRGNPSRVVRVRFGLDDTVIAAQFADHNLLLYAVQSNAQLRRQMQRAVKRNRQLTSDDGVPPSPAIGRDEEERVGITCDSSERAATDSAEELTSTCYRALTLVQGACKLHSVAFMSSAASATRAGISSNTSAKRLRASETQLLIARQSNSLEVHACALCPGGTSDITGSVSAPGHRSEPRGLAISTDERYVVSASDGEAKIWSMHSRRCVSTLQCGYGLAVVFLSALKRVVVGTKVGTVCSRTIIIHGLRHSFAPLPVGEPARIQSSKRRR